MDVYGILFFSLLMIVTQGGLQPQYRLLFVTTRTRELTHASLSRGVIIISKINLHLYLMGNCRRGPKPTV